MNYRKQSSTTYPFDFYLVLSSDHLTGATGQSPLVQICNSGASSFTTASGAVTELGSGFYRWAGNATDRGTLGEIAVIISATGADTIPAKMTIVPWDPFDANLSLQALPAAAAGSSGGLPTVDSANGVKVSVGTGTGQLSLTSGKVVASSVSGNVTGSVGSVSGVTFPTNFDILSIEDTTGYVQADVQLVAGQTATQSSTIDANIVSVNGTSFGGDNVPCQPANGSISADAFAGNAIDSTVVASNALDSILAETGMNIRQAISLMVAALAGEVSGAGTTTVTISGAGVGDDRIVATVDGSGNRSALTLTPPS